jgi:hypothetical protein
LDDDERDAFAGHLDGMGMAQRMRRKPPANAGRSGELAQRGARSGRRPGPTGCRPGDDAEQRPDRQATSVKPGLELLPAPGIHADLAASAALSSADEDAALRWVEIVSASASASLTRRPARQSRTISARVRRPDGPSPARRITATISSTVGGSAG